MANQFLTTGSSSLGASGLNSLLTFFAGQFMAIKRTRGHIFKYVNNDASAMVADKGQTVTVPLYPSTSSNLLADGAAISLDDSVTPSVQVTLNKHRYLSFGYTELARALDGDATRAGVLRGRIAGLLNDTEADVCSLFTAGPVTNTVGSYNSAITTANATAAMGKLWTAKVPAGDPLYAFVGPSANAWQALSVLAEFNQYNTTGIPSPMVTGDFAGLNGKLWLDANWYMSQNVPQNGTSIDNCIFHPQAIVVAQRNMPTPSVPGVLSQNFTVDGVQLQLLMYWDGARIAEQMTLHALYGFSMGREDWAVNFKS